MEARKGLLEALGVVTKATPSPHLFVLGMEAFSIMADKAVLDVLLSSYKFMRSGGEVQISHLLFSEDMLVICKDSKEQLANLSFLLL